MGSWVGVFSVICRSSLGGIRVGIREVKETAILINRTFWWKYTKHYSIGGRAYPVRHYPIAIRLRDLAFDNKVALTVVCVNIRATCASALPTRSRSSWGPHDILRHSMCCADSSEWGLFRHNTRSAFRRTPSRTMQPILQTLTRFIRKSASPYCTTLILTIMSKLT